jgi:RimJ/RimL family protein N-acetyltransferase
LPDIDGDKLAKERNYNSQSFAEALSAFTRARKNNIDTIRTTTPARLMRTATFEAAGTITLEQLLLMMREHDEAHRRSLMARHLVQPTLRTERLVLRPFEENDAQRLLQIAGEHWIADTMISVPYPYALEQAHDSIHQYREEFQSTAAVHFAIAMTECPQAFMGYVAIKHIDREHAEGELSFWIDWRASGHGYITEAARAAVKYGFDEMNLNRICAYHMVRNPASGRVLAKLGFRQEGLLRQRVRKWSIFEDVLIYALLRSDLG